MIEYLQKFLLGSLMLYSVYYVFLRNEKTLRFNRFYLLLIIPVALSIPMITVHTTYEEVPIVVSQISSQPVEVFFETPFYHEVNQAESTTPFDWTSLIRYTYLAVFLTLLFRFTLNLFRLKQMKKQGEILSFDRYNICLQKDLKASFTFLNTIFTNQQRYSAGLLPESILKHEMAHVYQKHSYDIILIEIWTVVFWFNPIVYFIRQSIKLNHEFLADEVVCSESSSLSDYQRTLINYSKLNSNEMPAMSSQLTFGETKKRLKMMVKRTHQTTAWIRQSIGLVAIAAAVFAFGNRQVIAKESSLVSNPLPAENAKDSIPLEQKAIYPALLSSETMVRFTDEDGTMVESEFGKLSPEQKNRFNYPEPHLEFFSEIESTAEMSLTDWQLLFNKEKYGIWINGDQIPNEELSNYKPDDIYKYNIRKVAKNSSLGNFDLQFFALTKEFINKKYKVGDKRGQWLNYREFVSLNKAAEQEIQKNDTTLSGIRSRLRSSNALVRFEGIDGRLIEKRYNDMSPAELERFKLNEARPAYFLPPPPKGYIPDNFQEIFSDSKEYGVWIDGEQISNSALADYNKDDFHHFTKSKLLPNAKNYGKHTYQVNFFLNSEKFEEGVWINLLTIPDEEAK